MLCLGDRCRTGADRSFIPDLFGNHRRCGQVPGAQEETVRGRTTNSGRKAEDLTAGCVQSGDVNTKRVDHVLEFSAALVTRKGFLASSQVLQLQ